MAVILTAACSGGGATCEPDLFAEDGQQADAQASSDEGTEVWGLFYPTSVTGLGGNPVSVVMPDAPGGQTKIVWRVTGEGEFEADARGPEGVTIGPAWVEQHSGSNWARPGQEWGTGWEFPEPGCWTLTITRGDTEAEISIEVVPA